jgi:hypothetical protein
MSPFALFTIWRVIGFLTAIIATLLIPYLGIFSFPEILTTHTPEFLQPFANFDGVHYLRIAQSGYEQFQHAFFPLYPLLMTLLAPVVGGNYLVAGLLISNVAFLMSLYLLRSYLHRIGVTRGHIFWVFLALLSFPTSFFFGAVYTESLFFLFMVLTLTYLTKNEYQKAAIFALLASLTRFIGVFLFIPFLVLYLHKLHQKHHERLEPLMYAMLAPILGLATYSLYLYQTIGDPLAFFHSQTAFGREAGIILLPQVYVRYIKIFFTASLSFQYFISVVEFALFNLVLVALILDLKRLLKHKDAHTPYRLGLNLFSLVGLIFPTVTGTMLSVPRFILTSLGFFVAVGEMKNEKARLAIIAAFAILHVVLLAYFIQGYFVA